MKGLVIALTTEQGYLFEGKGAMNLRRVNSQQRSGSPGHWDQNLVLFSGVKS